MTRMRVPPVLVTGATGRVGRAVVDLLVDAGVPVRALTHRSEAAATLPANVEVVTGDLTVPGSLDAGLRGVGAVFLGSGRGGGPDRHAGRRVRQPRGQRRQVAFGRPRRHGDHDVCRPGPFAGTQIVTEPGRTLMRSFLLAGRTPPSSS